MLRLAFDFIITWRETRTRPNAYDRYAVVPFTSKDEYQISHTDPIPVLFIYRFYRIAAPLPPYILNR